MWECMQKIDIRTEITKNLTKNTVEESLQSNLVFLTDYKKRRTLDTSSALEDLADSLKTKLPRNITNSAAYC